MKNKAFITSVIMSLLFTLGVAGCGGRARSATSPPPTPVPTPKRSEMVVLGAVHEDPVESIREAQPLADYLAAHLAEFGIREGQVTIASDLETMAHLMKTGQVDLTFDSPYRALVISDQSGAEPILRRWKGGDVEYRTVFFARSDSGLRAVVQLTGHMIALEDEFSTSGYFLPITYLVQAGLKPVEKPAPDAEVEPDEVGYVFSGGLQNTLEWVLSQKVVAGAVRHPFFAELPEDTRAALSVLAETENVPRHVVVARPGIDPKLLQAIKSVLLNAYQTPEGQVPLNAFDGTTQFDELPSDALVRARELYKLLPER